jgi:hypothetical protein
MKRSTTSSSILSRAAAVGVFAVTCLVAAPAAAQYAPPPPEVIATLAPVYHEGRAVYWYNGYWHYREGGRWAYYHEEPVFLREHRYGHPAYWHHYGRR